MSFGAPTPPDPTATSNTQQQYNTSAATTQNQVNSYNQSNPYGSLSYTADPNSPSGYSVNTNLSAPNQALLNTQFGNQATAGGNAGSLLNTAGTLANNTAGMYSQAPNFQALNPASIAGNLNSLNQQYNQPIFDQQSSNLEAQLRNQGLAPGTEAYNNAKNLLARNQGDVTNQYETMNLGNALQAQNQNFGQQVTNYEAPLQTEAGLLQQAGQQAGYASPTAPQFQQTPTAQIQPANYSGAVQQNYTNSLQNSQNTWNNIAKLGVAGVGLAAAPFTGGASLAGAGALAGMFGGSGVPGVTSAQVASQPNPYGSMPQIGGGWG